MLGSLRLATGVAVVTTFLVGVQAIPKVTRTGRYLYQEDGTRFYIKGIAYQPQGEVIDSPDNDFGEPSTYIDPLAIPAGCTRDVELFKQAKINAVRVYSVDSSANHDACMKTFSDNGIYIIIDLALPLNGSIDRTVPSWSTNLLNQYLRTIDAFSKYDNVLAYNVGNEVVRDKSTQVAPYLKAAARDLKAYLRSKNSNALVGYASINGDSTWRNALADYLTCGSEDIAIDIYGLNDYSWCGDSDFNSAYAATTRSFANYNVVAYLGEFGCNTKPPRLFTEVSAIFSGQMSDIWSGGIAFSYFPARSRAGQFAMVEISADGKTATTNADWDKLVAQYGSVTPPNVPLKAAASESTYLNCNQPTSAFLASIVTPPTPNEKACECLDDALSCHFTPYKPDTYKVAGELINSGCSLLGSAGGSCDEIGGDGQKGVYGRLSGCDPLIKASYVMSQYFEATNKNPTTCAFGGNGTINADSSAAASAAASSCIPSPSAVFVPTLDSTSAGGSTSGSNSGSGSNGGSNANGGKNGAFGGIDALAGVGGMAVVGLLSAIWTLA
ncbi:1,3-beta-glucanosyltransferase [Ephemerocybe angulata]|uniref:1,3-beta-glucanosyltransferase n=1 Tax=Ephemerocybe angulata TaxID=980116 RepID=A0A8H6LY99_9AGAR|nr:1,3-beta-glucanosyltransferase [Tulosesus angulatus]